MKFKIYGVMGSISGGSSDLGNNTTCFVVKEGDTELIFDAGSGILSYMRETELKEFNLFVTHYHLDHVMGLPFVPQMFSSKHRFNFFAPVLKGDGFEETLRKFFIEPFLPIKWAYINADLHFTDLEEGFEMQIDALKIKGMLVEHPGGCMVYSVESSDKKITILTDFPNGLEATEKVIDFCKNSDLLYVDAFFIEEEFKNPVYLTYGHASVESVIKLQSNSEAKKLILGHHKMTRHEKDLKKYATDGVLIGKENTEYNV